jgi:hypothetical protein
MEIFAARFGTIFLVLFLPTFPVTILQQEAAQAGNTALAIIAALASAAVGLFAFGALMIVISDVCLGNRPSIGHAYRRVFGTVAGKLALGNIAQILVLFLGFLLLIVPGLVAMVWLMFVSPVVVLEGKWGFEAFKRSKRLGDGFHWRNAGALLLLLVCVLVVVAVVGAVMGVLFHLMLGTLEHWLFRTLIAAIQLRVTQPLVFITIGLLYYDLRVRKESYDVVSLAEELRDEVPPAPARYNEVTISESRLTEIWAAIARALQTNALNVGSKEKSTESRFSHFRSWRKVVQLCHAALSS